jgi:hypothetical protein
VSAADGIERVIVSVLLPYEPKVARPITPAAAVTVIEEMVTLRRTTARLVERKEVLRGEVTGGACPTRGHSG